MEESRGELVLATDADRMDVDAVHAFLSRESYWAQDIPREVVARSIAHSLCFGVFDRGRQVAFARVVTDRATYAYLCDVYVLASHRGQGIATWMMEAMDGHPDLQRLRRWNLVTRDAHSLYAQHRWVPAAQPESYMERLDREVYKRGGQG